MRKWLRLWRPPAEVVLISTAVLVGVGTGLGAVVFIRLLAKIGELRDRLIAVVGDPLGLFLAMAACGVLVGWMVDRFAREAKGHGVPEVMEAVALRGGRIRPRVAAIKVLASSLTIGSGGSAGREGPIVQVGSALGSTVGQLLGLSSDRVRTLVACGAAAGISATFNAPIAGAIFALELILDNFTARNFGGVVISAVAAGIVSRIFLSTDPAFIVPAYPLHHLGELPIYVVLGVLAALVAVAFIHSLYGVEGLFDRWRAPLALKATVGMLLTALVGLALPGREVLGSGLEFVGEAIAANFDLALPTMAALLLLKMVATSLTLGAGNSGGVFTPSLFLGAMLGGLVGHAAHNLWPEVAINPGAYAIVGMAAVFAGAARAPITAILIVFEMSNDYRLILPLMLATVLSTLLAERLSQPSIYTLKLKLKGITLKSGRDVDVMEGVTVGEVMATDFPVLSKGSPLTEVSDVFSRSRNHGIMILDDDGSFWGLVTLTDLDRAVAEKLPVSTPVSEIGVPRERVQVAFPDETMGEALGRMSVRGFGRLPVLDRDRPRQLVGLIRRSDVIRAYNVAIARRAELQHRTEHERQRHLDGTRFVDPA